MYGHVINHMACKWKSFALTSKSGLEALLKANPIRAIFLGVRIGDPTAVGQEQFSPSSSGWPPFMRVNPILDWSYSYTSIGSIHDTVPNDLLSIRESTSSEGKFRPAYLLADGRLERAAHKFLMYSTFMSTSKCMEAFRSVRCPSPNEA